MNEGKRKVLSNQIADSSTTATRFACAPRTQISDFSRMPCTTIRPMSLLRPQSLARPIGNADVITRGRSGSIPSSFILRPKLVNNNSVAQRYASHSQPLALIRLSTGYQIPVVNSSALQLANEQLILQQPERDNEITKNDIADKEFADMLVANQSLEPDDNSENEKPEIMELEREDIEMKEMAEVASDKNSQFKMLLIDTISRPLYEPLWNKNLPLYHQTDREGLWKDLSLACKCSVKIAKATFRQLKNYYNGQRALEKKSRVLPSGSGNSDTKEEFISSWRFYSQMTFLDKVKDNVDTTSSINLGKRAKKENGPCDNNSSEDDCSIVVQPKAKEGNQPKWTKGKPVSYDPVQSSIMEVSGELSHFLKSRTNEHTKVTSSNQHALESCVLAYRETYDSLSPRNKVLVLSELSMAIANAFLKYLPLE